VSINPEYTMMLRYLLCLLGVLLALPILALSALAFGLPITVSGIGYLLAGFLLIAGLIVAPWTRKYSLTLVAIGIMAVFCVAGMRLGLATRNESSDLRVVTLPQGNETRWINLLVDEQDSLIFGEAIFHRIGGDSPHEHDKITEALHAAYSEMRGKHGSFASPFLSTYIGFQQPTAFDAVIVQPEVMRNPETAVIFLHGYMGNVTAQCWEIAQAVEEFGAVTVCPSTDWTGGWWHPNGEAILQNTFRYLREQGIQNFYLGGFSNGGFGISRIVSSLAKEDGLRGLFFINGISDGESIRGTGLSVLIIQGTSDERVPAAAVRPIAEVIGDLGTYVEIEGDHFMIMKQPEPVQNAIAVWLSTVDP
jgi:pimeloyl-ACP methyl ester carboxylesterase